MSMDKLTARPISESDNRLIGVFDEGQYPGIEKAQAIP